MRTLILLLALASVGCDLHITNPAPVIVTGGTPGGVTVTQTTTQTVDRSDTATTPGPTPSPTGTPSPQSGALPLPSYGEGVARELAAAYSADLAASCALTHGEAAWTWLDRLMRTLQARDPRWGFLCKDTGCTKVAADIVAYKAGTGDTGFWIVDVIGNHCPNPGDVVQVRWGVLPFETVRRWSGTR